MKLTKNCPNLEHDAKRLATINIKLNDLPKLSWIAAQTQEETKASKMQCGHWSYFSESILSISLIFRNALEKHLYDWL